MSDKAPEEMESERWAGDLGEKWNTYADQFEGMLATTGKAALDFAAFTPGERVIDIGCGAGITTMQIADRVGPEGHVTGLDLSETLIATSKRRAREAGLENVDFIAADAGSVKLETDYEHLFSRFGTMFFEDPYAAFRNLGSFLRPGGRASFVCWGPPAENPWVFELMKVVGQYVDLPAPVPNAPGPFAFADADYLRDILEKAGFTEIEIKPWSGDQLLGGPGASAEKAARFIMDATFVGEVLEGREASLVGEVLDAIVARLEDFEGPDGVTIKGTTWLVKAVH